MAAATPQPPPGPAPTTTTTTTLPTAPPASPPLPQRHTAVTPGPRAARLQDLYASSLKHTLARISWENFAACYPTIAANAPDRLRKIRAQMIGRVEELCRAEFESVMEGRGVVAKLNELESLVSEAGRRRRGGHEGSPPTPTPPHLLPPSAVLAAHLAPHLGAHAARLHARIQDTHGANLGLAQEVAAQRAEVEAILAAIERAAADIGGAQRSLEEGGLAEELGKESREVEAEMGMEGVERASG